jgi:hypothetical protein
MPCDEGLPAASLLSTILARNIWLRVMEDNEAMMNICNSGKNPTMRYLNRTYEVGISWLMGVFKFPGVYIQKRGYQAASG